MEPGDVEDKTNFWINPILKELRRQKVSFEKIESDLELPPGEVRNLREDEVFNIDKYLKIFNYLGLRLRSVNEVEKPLKNRKKFDISKAVNFSKINIRGSYIDMSSLYDARDRAVEEMSSLGKEYKAWGATSHRRLQVAADNVMLINIIEDLFRHGRKSRS